MQLLVHLTGPLIEDHSEQEVTTADRQVEVVCSVDWVNPRVTMEAVKVVDTLANQPWPPLHGVKSV